MLYFPRLSLPPSRWVNQAVLFFGQIGVIAPGAGYQSDRLFDQRTRLFMDAGVVRAVEPNPHFAFGEVADQLMLQHILKRAKRPPAHLATPSRIHVGKFEFTTLLSEVAQAGLARKSPDPDWYEVPKWVADEVMTYIALQIASCSHSWWPADEMDLITDKGMDWTAMTGGPRNSGRARARMRAVTALLDVPDDVSAADLIAFRQKYWQELKLFRELVEALGSDSAGDALDEVTFERRVNEAKEARDQVNALLQERQLCRSDRLAPFIMAVGQVAAAILDASRWSAAAGLGGLFLEAKRWLEGRDELQTALRSPMAYAAILKNELGRRLE